MADAPRKAGILRRLYYGETDYTFVSRWRIWFGVSIALILIGFASLGLRGLNFGIAFTGGNQWEVAANGVTVAEAEDIVEDLGFSDVSVQQVGDDLRVRTAAIEGSDSERSERNAEVVDALSEATGVAEADMIIDEVGPSWGEEISRKAMQALVVFLLAMLVYVTIRFEFRMALATIAALVHDVLIVVAAYAVFQFPVTPATVVAVLTILGFSIYDGVVVFDRVDENTRLLTANAKMAYSDMVDASLNQVLMRSLNTQITSVLPIITVLVVGSLALGAGTLQEFGIALFVGQVSGAYSSIFIASPALALLKEREPRYAALRKRLEAKSAKSAPTAGGQDSDDENAAADDGADSAGSSKGPKVSTAKAKAKDRTGSKATGGSSGRTGQPPRPRKKGKRR